MAKLNENCGKTHKTKCKIPGTFCEELLEMSDVLLDAKGRKLESPRTLDARSANADINIELFFKINGKDEYYQQHQQYMQGILVSSSLSYHLSGI